MANPNKIGASQQPPNPLNIVTSSHNFVVVRHMWVLLVLYDAFMII